MFYLKNFNDFITQLYGLNSDIEYETGLPYSTESSILCAIEFVKKTYNICSGIGAYGSYGNVVLTYYNMQDELFLDVTISSNSIESYTIEKGIGTCFDIVEFVQNPSENEVIENLKLILGVL